MIKGKDGKVISTKKQGLATICDHMNIQVDNPMNVLTQGGCSFVFIAKKRLMGEGNVDSARQFLSASHPQDKYKVCPSLHFRHFVLTRP